MAYQLPEKLRTLEPYQPIIGQFNVRLDANESFISLPDNIRKEIAEKVAQIDFNRYPDPYAVELCSKFANYFNVPSDLVVATNGSDELLFLLTSCFSDAGDTLMMVKPDFSMYGIYAELAGMRVEVFEKDDALQIGVDALIAKAKEKQVKILMFSNPCNPSSLIESREDVIKIVESLEDTLVIVDEAYMEFADNASVMDLVENYPNMMVLKTLSKAFGLAAARLGFAVSNSTLIHALKAAKSPYNVNTMSQIVGSIIFDHPEYINECIAKIRASRDALYNDMLALKERQPKIKSLMNTKSNFVYMEVEDAAGAFQALREQGIAIRLMKNYLRICAGSEEENAAMLNALETYLKGA
ncbi:MAG: histidinol-phosphate aminotransferase family protein [Peptococcaceae bacterium]|jgi:histidinol-phosphate aminotransferase|nr:histidinol-phosphate aminotransferase family protein [Peptococcaceae bacterium]